MTAATAGVRRTWSYTPASLRQLAGYLELALDEGESVVLMRLGTPVRNVYVGSPTGSLDDLTDHGTVAAPDADEILALTSLGLNQMTADGQLYRFTRSVRYIADRQVVVFTPT